MTNPIACYSNGTPVKVGDIVEVKESGDFTSGGNFHHHYTAMVNSINNAAVHLNVKEWFKHYSCSQRFGSSSPFVSTIVYFDYDYSRGVYIAKSKFVKIR